MRFSTQNLVTVLKISRLHERCFRILYSDYNSMFQQVLEKDNCSYITF